MKNLIAKALTGFGLALALTFPSFSNAEIIDTDQLKPNYELPHQKIKINRDDLEKKLQKFAKRDMDEEAWLYVEYKDGTGYAYEVGEDSDAESVDTTFAHSEEMLFILSDENIKRISVYHFHPGKEVGGVTYFPPSPSDLEFFMGFSQYFKFDQSPQIDSVVVDKKGVYTIQFTEDIGYPIDDIDYYQRTFLWYHANSPDINKYIRLINKNTQIILEFEEL